MGKKLMLGGILLMIVLAFGLVGCVPVGISQSLHETPQTKATEQHLTLEPTAPRPSKTPEMATAPSATLQPTESHLEGTTPPSIGPRRLTDDHLGLREYWRISARIVDLQAVSGQVVYAEYDSSGMLLRLRVLDAASGSLSWETPWSWKNSGPLAVDTERVYYEVDFKLRAYSLAEGVLLWETKDLLPFKGDWWDSDGETLCMRDWGRLEDRYFDARTGEDLGYTQRGWEDGFVLAQFPSFTLHSSPWTLQAVDVATQQVRWTIDTGIPAAFQRHPELFDDTLLTGAGEILFALDVQTGQIKWQNRDRRFASDWLTVNDSIYALDYNARLIRLDIETGQETGYIQFTPATECLVNGYCSLRYYFVATDGQVFFVYFGDSQELIALGP